MRRIKHRDLYLQRQHKFRKTPLPYIFYQFGIFSKLDISNLLRGCYCCLAWNKYPGSQDSDAFGYWTLARLIIFTCWRYPGPSCAGILPRISRFGLGPRQPVPEHLCLGQVLFQLGQGWVQAGHQIKYTPRYMMMLKSYLEFESRTKRMVQIQRDQRMNVNQYTRASQAIEESKECWLDLQVEVRSSRWGLLDIFPS